jgi:Rad51
MVSASGKTQFALQASLLVQLAVGKGGLSGSACYLTTNGILPTPRLFEIAQEHKIVTPETCNLDNVHTRSMSSISELRHVLSQGMPNLIQQLSSPPSSHPLRLLVLDSMSALFHTNVKTTSKTLFERSRELTDIALMLHHLASTHHLAILVINEVNSVFERDSPSPELPQTSGVDHVLYSEQARWYSRGDSLPSEGYKEASLGLVWASQIGLRVLMTRTGRRKHLVGDDTKRQRNSSTVGRSVLGQEYLAGDEALLIRRLSIIFSSFSPPGSIDFIILRSGITYVGDKSSTAYHHEVPGSH